MREFWDDHAPLAARIRAAATDDPLSTLREFSEWLESLPTRYPGRRICVLSDNPTYDLGNLDYLLISQGIRELSVRYLGGVYRSVCDPSEMAEGQGSWDFVVGAARSRVEADHWPENDAEHIYWMYIAVLRYRDLCLVRPDAPKDILAD